MTLTLFIIKEYGRIILKKEYKEHSDLVRGVKLYRSVPKEKKKSLYKCVKEVVHLFRYWNAFPDTYFRFGMFMRDYTDMKKMESYIPQAAYYRYSVDMDPRYHLLIDDKILFHDLMSHYGLPVPYRYFTFRGGDFRNGSDIMTDQQVDTVIGSITDERIFVKCFTGGGASGVSIFSRMADGHFEDFDGERVSANMIREKYKGHDYFFEKQLIQDFNLGQFNPETVNTIRVLTYKDKVVSAAVRFGCKGSFVDNTAKGGVAVSLDINTGKLGEYGMREYDLNHYTEHPDSHIRFENTVVPSWPKVKTLVEKTLKYFPYYNSVGFDIATTNEGPIIIEINTGAGIYLSQMGKEEGLAKQFIIPEN